MVIRDPVSDGATSTRRAVDPELARLAAAHRVAVAYEDAAHSTVTVARDTVVRALAALGVDASGPEPVRAALADVESAPWRRLLPHTVVIRQEAPATVVLRVPAGATPIAALTLEGSREPQRLSAVGPPGERRQVEGRARVAVELRLPAGLPLGYHTLRVQAGEQREVATLVVAPTRIPLPRGLGRVWGWMVQLYAVQSAGSWGLGDYADLAELVRWSGAEQGAGVVLVNPLHAPTPVPPLQDSPYYPSSRRFRSPLHLRVEATAEHAGAPAEVRAAVAAARLPPARDRLDRDAVWAAKVGALEELWAAGLRPDRVKALAAFRAQQGQGLEDFATFCVLAERHGVPWSPWPEELRRPDTAAVAAAREELADRVAFHAWLQLLCDEQLAVADAAARAAGMPVGIVHDLAVGVDPSGADAWALQDVLALGTTVGAPPDLFNQQGQDWGLPPWRPDRLEETGYAPYRALVQAVLRSAGGVRIDHVMGLFRLWWVPAGSSGPAEGTYVGYDAEALLGVLAVEATRAGALVVGEDLGTVEPVVTRTLSERGVLGSSVLWFEQDPDSERALPPARWRELAAATVTTHDLPTAAGFLVDEHVRVRAELGQLGHSVEEEQARVDVERTRLLDLLVEEGLLGPDPDIADTVLAMHAVLTRSPSRVVLAALGDAVGDVRQPNLPGTLDEYPNWRLPVADRSGHGLLLEELRDSAGVQRLAALLDEGLRGTPATVATAPDPETTLDGDGPPDPGAPLAVELDP